MSKNLFAKCIKTYPTNKKIKSTNMVENHVKICLNMKNKGLLSIEKTYIK